MDGSANIIADNKAYEAVKKNLLAEIGKTDLGKFLLDYLASRKIDIVVTDNVSKGNVEGGTAAAYWDPASNHIVIDPRAEMATLLHFFAHETRHAAQGEVNLKLPHQIEKLHPYNAVLHMRLQEMDADVFAVYFMVDRALKIKPQEGEGDDFARLSRPAPPPTVIDQGGREIILRTIDRSAMYRDFEEKWREEGSAHDMGKSLLASVLAFLDNGQITKFYADYALHGWEKGIPPLLKKYQDEPESDFATAFRDAAQAMKNNTYVKPGDIMKNTVQAYGKIFAEAGVPDYTAGIDFDKFSTYVLDESPRTSETWNQNRYQDQAGFFREAAEYYLKKAPLPAKNAKAKPPAKLKTA